MCPARQGIARGGSRRRRSGALPVLRLCPSLQICEICGPLIWGSGEDAYTGTCGVAAPGDSPGIHRWNRWTLAAGTMDDLRARGPELQRWVRF
jgi:hypothetical protein